MSSTVEEGVELEDYVADPLALWFLFSGDTSKQKKAHAILAAEVFRKFKAAPCTALGTHMRNISRIVDRNMLMSTQQAISATRDYCAKDMRFDIPYDVAKAVVHLLWDDINTLPANHAISEERNG